MCHSLTEAYQYFRGIKNHEEYQKGFHSLWYSPFQLSSPSSEFTFKATASALILRGR